MPDVRYLLHADPPLPNAQMLAMWIDQAADQKDPRYLDALIALCRQIPEVHERLESLVRLAEDAGIASEGPGAVLSAWVLDQQLRRLATDSDWSRPNEVLDPEGEVGVDPYALLRLARARHGSRPAYGRVIRQLSAQ